MKDFDELDVIAEHSGFIVIDGPPCAWYDRHGRFPYVTLCCGGISKEGETPVGFSTEKEAYLSYVRYFIEYISEYISKHSCGTLAWRRRPMLETKEGVIRVYSRLVCAPPDTIPFQVNNY